MAGWPGPGVAGEIGAGRTKSGSIDAGIVNYLKDDAFTKALAKATQGMRRAILNRIRETRHRAGQRYGEKARGDLQRRHVQRNSRRKIAPRPKKLAQDIPRPDGVRDFGRVAFRRSERGHYAAKGGQEHGPHDVAGAASRAISSAPHAWHHRRWLLNCCSTFPPVVRRARYRFSARHHQQPGRQEKTLLASAQDDAHHRQDAQGQDYAVIAGRVRRDAEIGARHRTAFAFCPMTMAGHSPRRGLW